MLRIPFEWFKFTFESFESLLNGLNLDANASNPFQMVRICIQTPFEWLEFAFEYFESRSKGSILHLNASNLFNGSDFHLNASNPFWMVRIWMWMPRLPFKWFEFCIRIPFEWLEFAFECFKYCSKSSNLHSNASNFGQMVPICISMLRIPFEFALKCFKIWFELFEFAFECFESLSNGSNLHSKASNPFQTVRIWMQMLRIPFKWFEFGFECFECLSNG